MLSPFLNLPQPKIALIALGTFPFFLNQKNGGLSLGFSGHLTHHSCNCPEGKTERWGLPPVPRASYEFQPTSEGYLLLFTLWSRWVVDFMYFFPHVDTCSPTQGKFVTTSRIIVCVFFIPLISVFSISFLPFILVSICFYFSNFLRLELKSLILDFSFSLK